MNNSEARITFPTSNVLKARIEKFATDKGLSTADFCRTIIAKAVNAPIAEYAGGRQSTALLQHEVQKTTAENDQLKKLLAEAEAKLAAK